MNKRILLPFLIFGMLFLSAYTYTNKDRLYEISKNIEIFINVYKELNANYVDDIDPTHLMSIGLDAMVGSLDPYTNYISESEVTSYRISTDGKYEGIGAVVKKVGDYVTIVEPYQDSPVLDAGLKAGDQIIAIEGWSVEGKTREEVTTIFRGVPGTEINLTIQRPGLKETFDVQLLRSEVDIPNVPYSGFVSNDIGYISLTTFTHGAASNVREAVRDMKKENPELKGIILDLRNNGGGLLAEAVKVSNVFIPKGREVVSVKNKVSERDVSYKTQELPVDEEIPLVVMINKNSASASEIVSGTIQDYDRGILMGQRSYGKGLVQNTKPVGFNSQLKLTTSKYYIPSGRCIQSVEYRDGEPVDIPDNRRAKFKTKGGRTVLDGGGVSPDLYLPEEELPEIVQALEEQDVIFRYVTEFVADKPLTDSTLEEIVFVDFNDFRKFVASSDFEYKTENEELIAKLEKNFKEKSHSTVDNELNKLKAEVKFSKEGAMDRNQELITDLIEENIATRYHLQKGKTYQRLKDDEEIRSAIALLKNTEEYSKLLSTDKS